MMNSPEQTNFARESYELAQSVSPYLADWLGKRGNVVDGVNTDIELMANFQYLGGKQALGEYPEDLTLQTLKSKIMERVLETTRPPVAPPVPVQPIRLPRTSPHK